MDSVANLVSEHVVDEPVLGYAGEALECRRRHHRVEVVTVSGDLGARSRNPGLDTVFKLLRRCRHLIKGSDGGSAILREAMITLTDKGAEKVREFLDTQQAVADTAGLRVGVRGGGCSGFQYALAFDEERDGDTVFEDRGIRLLVDRPSLPYVKGSVIDFVDGLQGAGFRVDNPNVIAACGCGSSFRVADEEEVSAV